MLVGTLLGLLIGVALGLTGAGGGDFRRASVGVWSWDGYSFGSSCSAFCRWLDDRAGCSARSCNDPVKTCSGLNLILWRKFDHEYRDEVRESSLDSQA